MIRPISTLTVSFALCLAACGTDKDMTSATNNTPATVSDSDPSAGSESSGTSSAGDTTETPTSTDEGSGTAVVTTGIVDPSTTSSSTTEPLTTTEPNTSSTATVGSTTDTDSTGGTTGGAVDESPYGACSNDMKNPIACQDGATCIDAVNTMGQVMGSFCSPMCTGPGKICPDAADGVAAQGAECIFGADPMKPTNCALICVVGKDECGPASECEDIGFAPMMGVTAGICTTPVG